MRVLLDTCVWGGASKELVSGGHDVVWVGLWTSDPGDDEIIAFAFREKRILVTLDKDFGEMAIVRNTPHCGIVRLVSIAARRQGAVCSRVLDLYGNDLLNGAIVTVTTDRLRFRPPGGDPDSVGP